MARRAAELPLAGADDLGRPPRDDELGQLTAAFNGWSRGCARRCRRSGSSWPTPRTSCAVPVSIIRTAADVALSRDAARRIGYREALAITAAQARRLGTLVDDMLVLARADAGAYPLRPVDLFSTTSSTSAAGRSACSPRRARRGRATGATDVSSAATQS